MKKFFFLMLSIVLLASCGQADLGANNGEDTVNQQELPGRTMSDQNPNLVNIGSERNHRRDIEHARNTILKTKEFSPDTIWINGDDMWITAITKGPLTERERLASQAKLHKALVRALPSYHIEVKLEEDRQ